MKNLNINKILGFISIIITFLCLALILFFYNYLLIVILLFTAFSTGILSYLLAVKNNNSKSIPVSSLICSMLTVCFFILVITNIITINKKGHENIMEELEKVDNIKNQLEITSDKLDDALDEADNSLKDEVNDMGDDFEDEVNEEEKK